jgi:hypothetical protein
MIGRPRRQCRWPPHSTINHLKAELRAAHSDPIPVTQALLTYTRAIHKGTVPTPIIPQPHISALKSESRMVSAGGRIEEDDILSL